MKDYRVGTDIKIKWKVTINEGTISLTDADLTLQVCNRIGQKWTLPIAVAGDIVEASFYGTQQKAIGCYTLTLWLNYGKVGQAVIDHIDAFNLVPFSSYIADNNDPDNIETDATVELEGCVTMGLQGESAYQSWLRQGYEGSEADFIAWVREPAIEAYFEATAMMEEFSGQEETRKAAEVVRETNEQQRSSAEAIRTNNEEARVLADSVRQQAENQRKANETQRLTQEATRVAQEEARVEADKKRKGIVRTVKTKTVGLVDTYTIYYTDGSTETYQVTNGAKGDIGTQGVYVGNNEPTGDIKFWIDPTGAPSQPFVVQETGQSTTAVMSQKATTDAVSPNNIKVTVPMPAPLDPAELPLNKAVKQIMNNLYDYNESVNELEDSVEEIKAKDVEQDAQIADIEYQLELANDDSKLPTLGGQPMILFGNGTPQEAIVPDNWKQFNPDTGEGYNWDGTPNMIGQQYVNYAVNTGGLYIAVRNGVYDLKWVKC